MEQTLKMFHLSRLNQKLLAYEQLHGFFDYNTIPMPPPDTKVLVHETSANKSWVSHRVEGWYVEPAMKGYCCLRYVIPKTGSERIAETVPFILQQL